MLFRSISEIKILNDRELNTLQNLLAENNLKISSDRLSKILLSSYIITYNPFKDYFNSLHPWDESTDYLLKLTKTVNTTNNYLWQKCFLKWIVGVVACIMDEDATNQEMIVLSGKQGIGKTKWLLKLLPFKLRKYKYSGSVNANNKDTLIYLSECMFINLDELEAIKGIQLEYLKFLITKESVKLRRPYGRVSEDLPRRASFVASVNNNEFLNDLSGSRRFLCFEILDVDYIHDIEIDAVYAQAYFLWKSGFKYWFDNEEIDEINSSNENHRIKTIEETLLFEKFESCGENEATEILTATEILVILHSGNRNNVNNASLQTLGKVLSHYKFNHAKRKKGKVYFLKPRDT